MNIKEIRKNKGDCTFYLTKDGIIYRLIKKRKAYAKPILKDGNKTTKITACDILFSLDSIDDINFNGKGLRAGDKEIIVSMIKEYEGEGSENK